MTDVITRIAVPATTADYGVLLPLPSAPMLDPKAVASAGSTRSDGWTAPECARWRATTAYLGLRMSGKSGAGGLGHRRRARRAGGAPVTIGPVTAVTLTAIPATQSTPGSATTASSSGREPIDLDAYAGPGRYSVAIRRSDTAATGGPTSVGSLARGDERGLPLRFALFGASRRLLQRGGGS